MTNAQDYKPFKIGLGLGTAMCNSYGSVPGALVTLEPGGSNNSSLAWGFRLELAAFDSVNQDQPGGSIASYSWCVMHYFSSKKFRPFVGGGLGGSSVNDNSEALIIYPRVGFDVGHFSLSADYNFILPNTANEFTTYLGIRIGFFVGGGKKSEKEKSQ
jgi:hypothetical protein